MKNQTKNMDNTFEKIFFFLAFLCINICEFVKNIYFLFAIAIVFLIFSIKKEKNNIFLLLKRISKNNFIYFISLIGLILFAMFNNPFYKIEESMAIVKSVIFMFIMVVMSLSKNINGKYIKYGAMFGYIHVLATYFFLLFPSLYINFAMKTFGYFPIGTNMGLLGYTAGLTSHYSANALYITGCIFALLYMNRCNKKSKLLKVLLFFAVGALLLTSKRAHILFTVIAIIIIFFLDNKNNKMTLLKKMVVILIFSLMTGMILFFLFPKMLNVFTRFGDGLSGRINYWVKALEWFKMKPITGIGWLQFNDHYKIYNFGVPMAVHNVYLQVLCECGIVGLLLFLNIVLISLVTTLKKYKNTTNLNEKNKYYYSLLIQIFFILYCLTGNCLYDNTMFFYSIASGLGMALQNDENKKVDVGDEFGQNKKL